MANELVITATLDFQGSGNSAVSRAYRASLTVTGTDYIQSRQTIGTSEEAIALPADMATPGYIFVKNLDSTNFVLIRNATGAASTVKLKAGEFALYRLNGAAPFAIADTSACVIEYIVIED